MRWFGLLAMGCTAASVADPAAIEVDPESPEPIGATDASHGKVPADYSILMGDAEVPRLDLVMTAASYQAISDDLDGLTGSSGPGPGGPGGAGGFSDVDPIYVPVTVVYGEQSWPQVGFRYKGNSSLYSAAQRGVGKLPFRLSMDRYEDDYPALEDQRFYGFQDLKFSSAYSDSTLQRDKLASDTFREAGVPAAKGGFVRVYVDTGDGPVFWGLYTVFEDPAGELLDTWFGTDDGNAYKPDGDAATLASFVQADFEKKTHEDAGDFSDVRALVEALNADPSDPVAWRAQLDGVFDTAGFLRYLALNNLIGNWDAYGRMTHNYYLYGDPDDGGRLTWIPWDFNEAYGEGRGTRDAIDVDLGDVSSGWPLLTGLAADPVYREAYEAEVAELLSTVFTADAQAERIEANRARIEAYADQESAPYTNQTEDFEQATQALASQIATRRAAGLALAP